MIEFNNVSYKYKRKANILKNFSAKIETGEFVFIIGNSGAGKTTLIRLLTRELKADSGEIIVDGQNLNTIKRSRIPYYRRKIGVVFQDFKLLNDRNIYENIAFVLRVTGQKNSFIKNRVSNLLTYVGLAESYRAKPLELSGGERQRVAIARALVNSPKIILADEPTGNLDPNNSIKTMQLLEEINQTGTTVIVVTHNQELVNNMKKRVIRMENGRIIDDKKEGSYRW